MRRATMNFLRTAPSRSVALYGAAFVLAVPALAQPPGVQCGLGKDFHAGRRQALLAELAALDPPAKGLLVLRGLPASRTNTRFSQDKVFWYLTGIESPDAAILVDLATAATILSLPAADRGGESWDGEKWDTGDPWVADLTGIADIRGTAEFAGVLGELLAKQGDTKTVWTSLAPHVTLTSAYDRAGPYDRRISADKFDGRPSRERAFATALETTFGAEVRDITGVANKIRRTKTAPEITAMRGAAHAGAMAMAEAMRSTRPGLVESELEAVLDLVHRRLGATGPAYQAIVGSGANSLILHYKTNTATLRAGDVVLIDYAPEFQHYVCDITRTWPVDGKFTARQAELYDAVLAAQEAGIALARPGNGIADVERACREVLQESGFAHLIRHGACHLVGMEVHDPGLLRGALVPGVAFTIEPGLYEPETGIGIRIEDVVVITEDGCEVISAGVPKARAAIEKLIAERGVLEWMDERAVK